MGRSLFSSSPVYFLIILKIPYPIVSLVTRMPQTLQGLCPVTIRSRTFETITLSFKAEQEAVDVFESVKELTVSSENPCSYQLRRND